MSRNNSFTPGAVNATNGKPQTVINTTAAALPCLWWWRRAPAKPLCRLF